MKALKILVPTITLGLLFMSPLASHAEEQVKPDKVETVNTDSGEQVEVKYFDDASDAEKYTQQKFSDPSPENIRDKESTASLEKDADVQPLGMFSTTYEYNGSSGYIGRNFDVQVYENNTGSNIEPDTTVKRSSTDSVTISLNATAEFKSVFSAGVGATYGQTDSKSWTSKFDGISVPPGEQLEIWTNNVSKKHSFTEDNPYSSDRNFTAYQSTDSWEHEVIVTDIRDVY